MTKKALKIFGPKTLRTKNLKQIRNRLGSVVLKFSQKETYINACVQVFLYPC